MYFADANLLVNAGSVFRDGRRSSHGTTNGDILLAAVDRAACARGPSIRIGINRAQVNCMDDQQPLFLDVGAKESHRRIAVRAQAGAAPGVVWLGGFKSDMKGTKAQAL